MATQKGALKYPAGREPLKTHRRIVRPHEPVQRRPAHNLEPKPAEQLIEAAGRPGALHWCPLRPFGVGIGGQPRYQGVDRNRPITDHAANACHELRSPDNEPQSEPRKPVELAERTKYHQVLRLAAARNLRDTRVPRPLRNGFVTPQHAPAPPCRIVQLSQPLAAEN